MNLKLILLFLTIAVVYAHGQPPAIIVQSGHTNRIAAADISSDDHLLVTGGIDQMINVWNLNTGKLLKRYKNQDAVYSLAFLPEDETLISGGYGISTEAVKIWNLGEDSYVPMSGQGGGMTIEQSPKGTFLGIGNSIGSIAFYDMQSGKGLRYYSTNNKEAIKALAFSEDETLIAVGQSSFVDGSTVYIWSTASEELITQFDLEDRVVNIQFLNNDELLIELGTWTNTNTLFKYNISTGEKQHLLDITEAVLFKDHYVIGYTADHILSVFNIESGLVERELHIHENFVDKLVVDHAEELVVAMGKDIECLHIASGDTKFLIEGVNWTEGMSFAAEGNKLAFTAEDGDIVSWDLESGEVDMFRGHHAQARDLSYDRSGNYLASIGDDSTAIIWNHDGSIKHRIPFNGKDFNTVNLNPFANWMAVSISDSIFIYNVESAQLEVAYSYYSHEAQEVIFSPNNHEIGYLIGNLILVHDWEGGTYPLQKVIGTASLEDIAFSSDGRYVATGGYTDSLVVFDLHYKDSIAFLSLLDDGEYVNSLAMDPSSQTMAAGFSNGMVRVYDISTREMIIEFNEFGNLVNQLSFREDGKVLAASSWDGKLVLWNMQDRIKLAELYAFDDGTWAVIDDDGRYDASNAGDIDHIHFAVGTETISLSQLKDRFYEPGLLQKLLGYNSEPLRDVSRLTRVHLYPTTLLNITDQKLKIECAHRDGGIGKVQLLINGKEIEADMSSDLVLDSLNLVSSATVDLDQYSNYFKGSSDNSISVVVYNSQNYLASPRITAFYQVPRPPPPTPTPSSEEEEPIPTSTEEEPIPTEEIDNPGVFFPRLPRLFGIVIGTANYRGEQLDLQFADKDAADFSSALLQTATALFGERNVDISTFNTSLEHAQPQKDVIRTAFVSLSEKAGPDDILVIYMSGHGTVHQADGRSQFHYLTMDMENGNLSDKIIREAHSISSDELTSWINQIPVEKQVLILDACSSGQAIEDILVGQKGVTSGQVRALERMKDRTGMFILTGSASDKVSFEASRFGQSLLTYSLLSGIKGQALREGQFVDVLELFSHAVNDVPELASYIGGIQKPILSVPYNGLSFDIGKVDESVDIELASVKPVFIRSNFQDEDAFDDVLGLSEGIDEFFRYLSYRAKTAEVIFVDVNKYPDAYSIKGRYTQIEGEVQVKARVFKGKEVLAAFEMTGIDGELDQLIQDIIFQAQEFID